MDDDVLGGTGCISIVLAIIFAIAAAFLHINIIHAILVGGGIGIALGIIALFAPDSQTTKYDNREKSKRKEKPKTAQKPDRIIYANKPEGSVSRSQQSRVSRLEVPGGYVPFEMTKTETKTKDTVTTETKIKTYVDSREVKAILKGSDAKLLNDGK